MQDSSTPSPSDPGEQASGEPTPPRKQLKLKRIVIEDLELHPEAVESKEPVPEAKPYEEPEEAPVPGEFKQQKNADTAENNAEVQATSEDASPDESEMPPPQEEPVPKPQPPGKAPEIKQPASPFKRLAFILVPAVLIAVVLLGLNMVFDPFGNSNLAPVQPRQESPLAGSAARPEKETVKAETGFATSSPVEENAELTVEAYVLGLQNLPLAASDSPKGLFLGPVFVPEGAIVNRELSLRLSSVSADRSGGVAILKSDSGDVFPLQLGSP